MIHSSVLWLLFTFQIVYGAQDCKYTSNERFILIHEIDEIHSKHQTKKNPTNFQTKSATFRRGEVHVPLVQNVPSYPNQIHQMPANAIASVIITNLTNIIRATVTIVCLLTIECWPAKVHRPIRTSMLPMMLRSVRITSLPEYSYRYV